FLCCLLSRHRPPRDLHSFPTRRSSDLVVPHRFHARHDAVARRYLYQIARRRTAFAKPYVWWVKDPVDVARMRAGAQALDVHRIRSEEHTSELQSPYDLVCRLLLEKKNN